MGKFNIDAITIYKCRCKDCHETCQSITVDAVHRWMDLHECAGTR